MKNTRKILSLLLATLLLLSAVSALSVSATAPAEMVSGNFTYYVMDSVGKAVITGTSYEGDRLVVPATIDEYPVHTIAGSAFARSKFSKVIISEGIAEIGAYAFDGCKNLSYVFVPDSVTSIYHSAFLNCENLKSILIPKTVTHIDETALGYYETIIKDNFGMPCIVPGYYKDFTIMGFSGSQAQIYTALKSINFEMLANPNLLGDTNLDGKVTVRDATFVQKYIAGITPLHKGPLSQADLTADGKITIQDATAIQKLVAGITYETVDNLPEVKEGYNRYFFYKPESWENEYAYGAGIYWSKGSEAPESFPGYEMNLIMSYEHGEVYFYDVPEDVDTVIFNNFFNGGSDPTAEYYTSAIETVKVPVDAYSMIYVTDAFKIVTNPFSGKHIYEGEWFHYYGNGEYGNSLEKPQDPDYIYTAPMISWLPLHLQCDCNRHNSAI